MANVLRLAVVDPDDSSRESLKNLLLGMDTVWLEAECSRYEFFADIVQQCTPDVGVVVVDSDPEKALKLVQRLRDDSTASVLVISSSDDGSLILRSMRAGAKEFLTKPLSIDELIAALERIAQHHGVGGTSRARTCLCTAIAGAGGGVGTTSLAVNLGCALASDEANTVALVDLDLSLGDADVFLDSIPDYTLIDVAQNITRMDFSLLKKSMTRHSSGLYLLSRPVQLQDVGLITAEDFRRVLGLLKASFSHVLIDLSKSFGPLDWVALGEADHVLLVTQLDLPCLRNVVRLIVSFEEVEGLKDKTRIVVNRVGLDAGQIGLKKAQETIGREIFWQIPNDYRVMVEVRNNGVPLIEQAPRAGITHSILGLAATLSHDAASSEQPAARAKSGTSGWLSFLTPRGRKSGKKGN